MRVGYTRVPRDWSVSNGEIIEREEREIFTCQEIQTFFLSLSLALEGAKNIKRGRPFHRVCVCLDWPCQTFVLTVHQMLRKNWPGHFFFDSTISNFWYVQSHQKTPDQFVLFVNIQRMRITFFLFTFDSENIYFWENTHTHFLFLFDFGCKSKWKAKKK